MLTDEVALSLYQKAVLENDTTEQIVLSLSRDIKAEVLKGYEQVGEIIMYVPYGQLCAPFARPEWIGGSLPPVGTKLYTTPQPPALCQKCHDYEDRINWLIGEREALQARVTEIERSISTDTETIVSLHEKIAAQAALKSNK